MVMHRIRRGVYSA